MAELEVFSGGGACGAGGCGGDSASGDGVGGSSADGDGAGGGLGEMRNVRVSAHKPDGTLLGQATLSGNLVSIYPRTYRGPFILEFKDDGSGNGEYFDEGVGAFVKLGASSIHVLVPLLTHHVSGNPLSEAAYAWAIDRYGSETALTAERMTEANNAVRDAFNLRTPAEFRVTDVTNYAVAVGPATVPGTLPNTHAGRFGTLLAGTAKSALAFNPALATGKPALEFALQLKADVVDDGSVNASNGTAAQKAYDAAVPQQLTTAIGQSVTSYASSTQPTPSPTAVTCFNPALFVPGGNWQLVYRDLTLTPPLDLLNTQLISGPVSFGGTPGLLEQTTDVGIGVTRAYFGADLSLGLVNHGNATTVNVGGSDYIATITYSPAYVDRRFLIGPGQSASASTSYTMTLVDASGNPFGSPSTGTFTNTTTFVGYEDVTVPAGTFRKACHYRIGSSSGGLTDQWVTSSGQGVMVKVTTSDGAGGFTQNQELVSGTVNGAPVR